jgi:hypothetical protein
LPMNTKSGMKEQLERQLERRAFDKSQGKKPLTSVKEIVLRPGDANFVPSYVFKVSFTYDNVQAEYEITHGSNATFAFRSAVGSFSHEHKLRFLTVMTEVQRSKNFTVTQTSGPRFTVTRFATSAEDCRIEFLRGTVYVYQRAPSQCRSSSLSVAGISAFSWLRPHINSNLTGSEFYLLAKQHCPAASWYSKIRPYLSDALFLTKEPVVSKAVSPSFRVTRYGDDYLMFSGSFQDCTNFLRDFDSRSDTYVDLRILDSEGNDCPWDHTLANLIQVAARLFTSPASTEAGINVTKPYKPRRLKTDPYNTALRRIRKLKRPNPSSKQKSKRTRDLWLRKNKQALKRRHQFVRKARQNMGLH